DDAHVLADGAQQRRQVLRPDDDQRHDAEDQELAGGEVEHLAPCDLPPPPALSASAPARCSTGFGLSTALGGSSFLAGSSSSAMPFLKLFMPLATSPMMDEI